MARNRSELARQLRAMADAIERGEAVPEKLAQAIAEVAPEAPGAPPTKWAERLARGMSRGLTRAQAAGRPRKGERRASEVTGRALRGAAKRARAQAIEREAVRGKPPPPPGAVPWSPPTPGGTRDFRTGNRSLLRRGLEEARDRGRDVLLNVRSDQIEYGKYERPKRREEYASTGRTNPAYILAAIDAREGDVDEGVRFYLRTFTGTEVGEIAEFELKEFR